MGTKGHGVNVRNFYYPLIKMLSKAPDSAYQVCFPLFLGWFQIYFSTILAYNELLMRQITKKCLNNAVFIK